MTDMLSGIGIIQYDPWRPGLKHRTDWWCVLNVDKELSRYYRWWLEFEKHLHLQSPSWDAHISIVRGEKPYPAYIEMWKKYQGKKVEFHYKHGEIRVDRSQRTDPLAVNATGGEYYFIDIECPMLDEIRTELGLITGFNYHMTIARSYEYCCRAENRKDRRQRKK